jgi:putative hydrolase of the HAD superfamily
MNRGKEMLTEIKAIIWDFDGVFNSMSQPIGWTLGLKEHWDIEPTEFITAVLTRDFLAHVVTGKRDLYDHLRMTNNGFYPDDKVEVFGTWWFENSIEMDLAVVDLCKTLTREGYPAHLGTNNEPHRARHIWETVGMKAHMDQLFTSGHMDARKPHADYFEQIEKTLDLPPSALLLVDDYIGNIEGARACGWKAHHFTSVERLIAELGRS